MRILYVDEKRRIGELLNSRLSALTYRAADGSPFDVEIETDYVAARALLENGQRYDAAIIESSGVSAAGGVALRLVADLNQTSLVTIVLTALPSLEECVKFMRAGAWDYIAKVSPIDDLVQRLVDDLNAARPVPRVDRDALFVQENFASLHRDYGGRWIAVANGLFLGAAATYDDLFRDVQEMPASDPKFWRMPPSPKEPR